MIIQAKDKKILHTRIAVQSQFGGCMGKTTYPYIPGNAAREGENSAMWKQAVL